MCTTCLLTEQNVSYMLSIDMICEYSQAHPKAVFTTLYSLESVAEML